jgi:hypothetical protein
MRCGGDSGMHWREPVIDMWRAARPTGSRSRPETVPVDVSWLGPAAVAGGSPVGCPGTRGGYSSGSFPLIALVSSRGGYLV